MTVASNSKAIECHHKTSYPGDIWRAIPKIDKEKINRKRKELNSAISLSRGINYGDTSVISEITQGTQSLPPYHNHMPVQPPMHHISQTNTATTTPPPPRSPPPSGHVSIIGGRNEQTSLRSRNPHS